MIEEDINLILLIIGAFLVVYGIAYYWTRKALYIDLEGVIENISKSTTNNNSLTHLNRIKECLQNLQRTNTIKEYKGVFLPLPFPLLLL